MAKPKSKPKPNVGDSDKMKIVKTGSTTMNLVIAPLSATTGTFSRSIGVDKFLDKINRYPVPPEYSSVDQHREVHPALSEANFTCGKVDRLDFHLSNFLFLTAIDPDLDVSMGYLQTRFLLLLVTIAAPENGTIGDYENSFLAAVHERANTTTLEVHDKQRTFFELWYRNADFQVRILQPLQRSRLAITHKIIAKYIDKNKSKLNTETYRYVMIVARLLNPKMLFASSHNLTNPPFYLSCPRIKHQRPWLDQLLFEEIVARLEDMEYVAAIGQMLDKLGMNNALFGEKF